MLREKGGKHHGRWEYLRKRSEWGAHRSYQGKLNRGVGVSSPVRTISPKK